MAPPNLDYAGYHKYTGEMLPSESPLLYGLHPNAEMAFVEEGPGQSAEEKVKFFI